MNSGDLYKTTQSCAKSLVALLQKRGETIATAESCTGGLVSAILTEVPGVSDVFCGSVVSYSNEVKASLLKVRAVDLARYGAVSSQVAGQMAEGCQELIGSNLSIALTGVAGPTGGTPTKPVGTVWLALCYKGKTSVKKCIFQGDRQQIRMAASAEILSLALEALQ